LKATKATELEIGTKSTAVWLQVEQIMTKQRHSRIYEKLN
jgi:hypothetical protein